MWLLICSISRQSLPNVLPHVSHVCFAINFCFLIQLSSVFFIHGLGKCPRFMVSDSTKFICYGLAHWTEIGFEGIEADARWPGIHSNVVNVVQMDIISVLVPLRKILTVRMLTVMILTDILMLLGINSYGHSTGGRWTISIAAIWLIPFTKQEIIFQHGARLV